MTNRRIATLQVLVAALAAAGCVASWIAARSVQVATPVIAGEPAKSTLAYDPPMLGRALFLAAIAGTALVFGVTRLRR